MSLNMYRTVALGILGCSLLLALASPALSATVVKLHPAKKLVLVDLNADELKLVTVDATVDIHIESSDEYLQAKVTKIKNQRATFDLSAKSPELKPEATFDLVDPEHDTRPAAPTDPINGKVEKISVEQQRARISFGKNDIRGLPLGKPLHLSCGENTEIEATPLRIIGSSMAVTFAIDETSITKIQADDTVRLTIPEESAATDTASAETEANPERTKVKKTGDHHSLSILAGWGRSKLDAPASNVAAPASQLGLQLKRSAAQLSEKLALTLALDWRYAKHKNSLQPLRPGNANATATLKRYDTSFLLGLNFRPVTLLTIFTEVGPSLQTRSLFIDANSGGDYYRGDIGGYLGRLGLQFHFGGADEGGSDFLLNLYYAFANGGMLNSGRLQYDLAKLNYNGISRTFGVEVGIGF